MSGLGKKEGVDNTARRKWDRDEFSAKAADREREEDELELAKSHPPPQMAIVQRAPLKQRGYEVDLTPE
jgi:U4/U6.U5 tri-snRNP component SNU23